MDSPDALISSKISLLAQADSDKDNLQQDGWGLGWFGKNGQPLVSKSQGAVFREEDRFRAEARRAASTAILGHLRAASNPRGIPREQLITLDNTQPFTDGRWLFAHNGTLNIPLEVTARLGTLAPNLKSKNDSEVYFWHWLKHQRRLGEPAAAFAACVDEIWDIWDAMTDKKTATPFTSLNAIVADAASLHALCHSVSSGLAKHAIFDESQPWQVMSWRQDESRLLVASEPVDEAPGWRRLGPSETLSAAIYDGTLQVKTHKFQKSRKGIT